MDRKTAIARITQMEKLYDALCAGIIGPEDQRRLTDYYESGAWLRDYERDERGELPPELKRGVLSQDGLYNALCERVEKRNFPTG